MQFCKVVMISLRLVDLVGSETFEAIHAKEEHFV